ncbi:Nuclear inhibitor of protein phosphatase 1 [Dermatophagoides pteronyssinus]|uniref:Nuclear inhibitor of protein phosphatase 1-like n=2 Tax=Dermatophagoides pteronyssinus TaxID=6956 RepID=A0A6P6XKY8_DERPT|nr:nuclear inhibitor of protein phosphatase 1-like [Dermatophagoides pteronyssinus]KAH9421110.1 Nuclear inhibitor of protein phosphatase 1 [Dermatophagoides pteronyssinus]
MADSSSYKVPSWAGIPPCGYHLDVMKDGKLVQKLMIDEKNHYLFGRNLAMTDFCIDHASCSRVHAALVYHKNLERFFLVDLGSTHGSFIGSIRIESNRPIQLPIDSCFHFGASTRNYILREKPKQIKNDEDEMQMSLPEGENEIDHLTEYNTAQNRRVSMLGVSETDDMKPAKAKKRKSVQFLTEDEIINPEDVDPNVGRFRNLVQTSIIPSNNSSTKRLKSDSQSSSSSSSLYSNLFKESFFNRINQSSNQSNSSATTSTANTLLQKSCSLGIQLPNPAPEIVNDNNDDKLIGPLPIESKSSFVDSESISLYDAEDFVDEKEQKKKYAKEAWPGHEKTTSLTNF